MEYTLSGIRSQILDDKLDDTSFNPDVVDRFINTAQRTIFNTFELPFQEKVFTGAITAYERIFSFPADVQVIQSMVITSPEGQQKDITPYRLVYKDFNTMFPTPANNVASSIKAWASYAGKMYTSAPLDQNYQMDTFYLKKPTLLTDDDQIPELPEEFQEALVLGAFYRIQQRNEDYDLAAATKNEYNDVVDQLVARYGFRLTGGPVRIRQPLAGRIRRSR